MLNPTIAMLAFSLLTFPAFAQQSPLTIDKPVPTAVLVGDPDRQFNSESIKSGWLAIHLLPTIGSSESRAIIQEYTDKAPTLAGVRHIFVSPESAESFRAALLGVPGGEKQSVYRDADNHLATQLSIKNPVNAPVLVVLDPMRRELLRHTGKTLSDCLPFSVFAKRMADATEDKETREANVASHLAIDGYDPVAYLDDQKAVPGERPYESAYKGITYRFASAANRDRFNADPARYLPAYGGWCATAMAKGTKVEIDPRNFKVTNGRLFLFYKGFFGNALNDWNKDEPGLTVKADTNWKKVAFDK